mmetsp:Transcript_12134/g.28041  ORF Transcript_12134/g.28041 Transcript_12134/m.28041 type:complete len:150 (-) Transcript_12134:239-688(-)
MACLLTAATTKAEIDSVIKDTKDKVVVLRFGRDTDAVCLQHDDILYKTEAELRKMAVIRTVDVDAVPIYTQYFDISLLPSTVFFWNAKHMKVDFGTQDHTKWIGAFHSKQDFIDLVEVIFRGGLKGKDIVDSPIPQQRTPKYQLIYKDI